MKNIGGIYMSTIPAYRQVYTTIKNRIREGTYKAGTMLPTETQLENEFGASRTTIRKAISLLTGDGYLKVRQGRGTEILDISTTQKLNYITSITETLTNKGFQVTVQGMNIDKVTAPGIVQEELLLPPNAKVYRVQRVQCANGQPVALIINYLKENLVPNLEEYQDKFTALYKFLESKYNIILTEATETLSAASADFMEAQILKIPTGSPLLCSKRVSYVAQGPLEYSIIKLVADKYEYSIHLKGRG